jgi:acyl carrier protein
MSTTLERIGDILRRVFDNPEIAVGPETTASDVDGWDSLSHVNVILAVESAFSIRFGQKELLSFKNVGDMAAAVDRRITASASRHS